ncbi:MAG: hypothetical protein HXY45_10975 [Syntrophaceae bacterium]|nr:hypothetical protein [Syntrophaceae bacterium]
MKKFGLDMSQFGAQVKTIIGVVLYLIAARMLWGLVGLSKKGANLAKEIICPGRY